MHTSSISLLLAGFALAGVSADGGPLTGSLGNATVVENNPPNMEYCASPPSTAFFTGAYPSGGNLQGSITAMSNPNGIGVMFKIRFSNLPAQGGPFLYHIHTDAVPADGNCTGAGGHLDPFNRGETPACDASLPQTCQVGDLSGKYGTINSDPFEATYVDPFASTLEGNAAFFGNRSFVLHLANTTRVTCGNFAQVAYNASDAVATVTETETAAPAGQTAYTTMTIGATGAATTEVATTTASGPKQTFVTVNAGAAPAPHVLLATAALFITWSLTSLLS